MIWVALRVHQPCFLLCASKYASDTFWHKSVSLRSFSSISCYYWSQHYMFTQKNPLKTVPCRHLQGSFYSTKQVKPLAGWSTISHYAKHCHICRPKRSFHQTFSNHFLVFSQQNFMPLCQFLHTLASEACQPWCSWGTLRQLICMPSRGMLLSGQRDPTLQRCFESPSLRQVKLLHSMLEFSLDNEEYHHYLTSLLEEYKRLSSVRLAGGGVDNDRIIFLKTIASSVEEIRKKYDELTDLRTLIKGR